MTPDNTLSEILDRIRVIQRDLQLCNDDQWRCELLREEESLYQLIGDIDPNEGNPDVDPDTEDERTDIDR